MNIDEWSKLCDAVFEASEIHSEKIDVTTLSAPEPRYIEATKISNNQVTHCTQPQNGSIYYNATCIIITDRKTHTSHNYCIYGRMPLDSLMEIKGLQELKKSESVMHLADKDVFIHIMCFTVSSKKILLQIVKDWFRNKSQSEEIDYREIIT